jgi:hypothetical protein
MPLSTIFQLYRGGQIYWWGNPEYTDLLYVNGQLNHLAMSWLLTTLAVTDIACTGSCKSN